MATDQLGKVPNCIIANLADAQFQNKELWLSKLDIKDGFWHLIISDEDAWNFCYAIPNADPNAPIEETRIVVPNSLQMGWTELPPFFCAATETAQDIIQQLLKTDLPLHPFEHCMLPKGCTQTQATAQDLKNSLDLIEVFADDFIGVTDNTSKAHLLKTS